MNNMEMDQVKIAIGAILILELGIGVLSYLSGNAMDMGTIGMGITAIAGIVGYDMKKE